MEENPVDDMPDVSLIDNDIAPAATDSSPSETAVETTENEGTDTQEKQEDAKETPSEGEQQPAEQQQTTETDDEAAIKARNEAYARQRILERQRTKQVVAQQLDQAYGPKNEQELIDEGLTEQQAQIEALRQEMYYKEQRTQIAELNAGMQAEAVQVTSDFPIFNPNSPEYDQEFAQMAEQQYKMAARLQTDENGIVINADVPLYDYYKQMHNIYTRAASRGQQQGQQEYQQMLSRTENPGGSSSTSKGDSLDELEERLGDVVIA